MREWTPEQHLRFELGYILAQSRKLKRAHPGDEPHWPLAERIIAERERGWKIERARRKRGGTGYSTIGPSPSLSDQ